MTELVLPTDRTDTRFWHFRQNNSGGQWDVDDKVGHHVFVEAENEEQVKGLARKLGIYFDGCSTGRDCSCCGDRWDEPDPDYPDEVRTAEELVSELAEMLAGSASNRYASGDVWTVHVHGLDGCKLTLIEGGDS